MTKYGLPLLVVILVYLLGLTQGYNLSDYRLPTNTYPVQYYLTLDLTEPELDTFFAQSWIEMNVTEENTYDFTFNVSPEYVNLTSMDLEVYTAHFICHLEDSSNVTQLMGVNCIYDMWGNYTDITSIIMYYQANFATSESPRGLVKDKFTVNQTDNWVIYSQFEPTGFRRVFPSFDEPAFKAPMRLMVDHHLNLTVVSNMEPMDDISDIKGPLQFRTSFKDTPKMSTYLLAVVAGPNDTWSEFADTQNRSYRFSVFAQNIFEDNLAIAMENGPKLLDIIGNWTGLSYETLGNTKITFAAIPGMDGAMENWGLVTFGESIIIDEGSRTTERALEDSITIIAHELSHQWFGDYVTLKWWSEVWLNEGFATYFQYHFANILSENLGLDKTFVIEAMHPAFEADGADVRPLSSNDNSVNSEDEIRDGFNKYSIISYFKGASILRMIRYALGDDVFQAAIQNYLQENALSNTRASDFINQLQNVLNKEQDVPDLSVYLDAWIHQPSYPVLKTSLIKDESGNTIVTINAYKFNTTEDSIWYIPLTYVSSENPSKVETAWIEPGKSFNYTLSSSNTSWSVINADARGYYRVEYDSESLSRIINVLNNSLTYENISVLSRVRIIDDVFALAILNNSSYEAALSVASYLQYEKEYHPWYAFFHGITLLLNTVENADNKRSIESQVLGLIEPQLVIPEGFSSKNFSHTEILKRNLLLNWACKLNQSEAVGYVRNQYQNFKNNNTNIDTDYRDVIICYGVARSNNSAQEFKYIFSLYDTMVNPQEKQDLVNGLVCSMNEELLTSHMTLAAAENRPIGKQFWVDTVRALKKRRAQPLLDSLSNLNLIKQ